MKIQITKKSVEHLHTIRLHRVPFAMGIKRTLAAVLMVAAAAAPHSGRAGIVTPYTNDTHTIMLDHLNGTTSASLSAVLYDGSPCSQQKPSTTPNYEFGAGPEGLDQALTLAHPAGTPEGSVTYLRYAGGQLLSLPNGTIEFWLYLSSYGGPVDLVQQITYPHACSGRTFSMLTDTSGQVRMEAWNAFDLNSSGAVIPLKTWTHVAATWGSTGAKLYFNGKLVGASNNTGYPAPGFGGSVFLYGGSAVVGSSNRIDELRISDMQRTVFNLAAPDPASLTIQIYAGLAITGTVGGSYEIQFTTNLNSTNWQHLADLTLATSPYLYIDTNSPANGHRFYRAIAPQ